MFNELRKFWFGPSLSLYPAMRMTGRTGRQVWSVYRRQRKTYAKYGIKVNSPLPGEGIKDNNKVIGNRPGVTGDTIWAKDGIQIRKSAGFVFPVDGTMSQGSIFELVKARGSLWKITVFINPKPGFISAKQADFVCKNEQQAAKFLSRNFLSRHQRFIWRIRFFPLAILKSIIEHTTELFR